MQVRLRSRVLNASGEITMVIMMASVVCKWDYNSVRCNAGAINLLSVVCKCNYDSECCVQV